MIKTRYSLILVCFLFFLGSCQQLYFKKAEKAIEKQDFELAIDNYKKLNKIAYKESNDLMIADLYFKTDQLDSSEYYYRKIISFSEKHDDYRLPFSLTLLYNGKVDEAKSVLEFNEAEKINLIVLQLCNSIYTQNDRSFKSTIIDRKINFFNQTQYRNGTYSAQTTDVFKGKVNDPLIAKAYKTLLNSPRESDGKWIPVSLLKESKSSRIYDAYETYSKDGNTVYFTRSIYSKNDSLVPQQKIFCAHKVNDLWSKIEEFPLNSDSYSVGQVCMSAIDNRLYFSSDMPGGYGGFDLYYSELKDGNWSKPMNLGNQINSSKNELFPIMDSLGLLCFSSNKDNSENLLDAFISYFDGDKWVKPLAINYPLFLSKNDHGFSFDPKNVKSLLSIQNKETTNNNVKFTLLGKAINKETKQPIKGALIEITTGRTGELIKIYSDKDGNFGYNLASGINYRIFLKNNNSYTETVDFSTQNQTKSVDFKILYEVETIKLDEPTLLLDSSFDNENYMFDNELKIILDELIVKLRNNSTVKIEIGSYSDQRGNPHYNTELTKRRSKVVAEYIISQGILAERIQFNGYGQEHLLKKCDPINAPCLEKDFLINRRVEYKVIAN